MPNPSSYHVVTEFTEDAHATEDRLCDRCHKPIGMGAAAHQVASSKPGRKGKVVCQKCFDHYLQSPSTTVTRTSGAQLQVNAATFPRMPGVMNVPDQEVVRRSVAAAQSRASINPPPVVPMSGLMLPPPPPMMRSRAKSGSSSQGPDIYVPNAWPTGPFRRVSSSTSMGAGSRSGQSASQNYGYRPQHAEYNAKVQYYSAQALTSVPPVQTYSLDAHAVFESSGRRERNTKNNMIGCIREGINDVPIDSTALDIATKALEKLIPKIKKYCADFPWREDEFVVRDNKWVNLREEESFKAWFKDACFRDPSTAKKAKASATPSFITGKQFPVYVVVPEDQWLELQQFFGVQGGQGPLSVISTTTCAPSASSFIRPTITSHSDIVSSVAQNITPPSSTHGVARPQKDMVIASQSNMTSPLVMTVTKRQHHRGGSSSSSSAHSPPPKKLAVFKDGPNREDLMVALRSGGGADVNMKDVLRYRWRDIEFRPIPSRRLNDVSGALASMQSFSIKDAALFLGKLRVDNAPDSLLGVGTFKTAQDFLLALNPLRYSGLGSIPNQHVAAKRPFLNLTPGVPARPPFLRLNRTEDHSQLYREANILYWAIPLLNVVYEYIEDHIAKVKVQPPFDIPRLRFVEAAWVTILGDDVQDLGNQGSGKGKGKGKGKAKAQSEETNLPPPVYLVEEIVEGVFFKYIHNGSAALRPLDDPVANEVAEFLSFTQHVQYVKTKGLAYLSDYQGSLTLLTDPQILTHRDTGSGLFGEGNVEVGVENFKHEHECNKFCEWFGLEAFGTVA